MKKIVLSGLLLISTIISLHAQLYTPSGTVLGTSTNNNVGIGTATPSASLDINSPSMVGMETLLKLKVSDTSEDYLKILNTTGASAQFIPSLYGYHATDNRQALYLVGEIGLNNDIGSEPIMVFDSRLNSSAITNRPLFAWDSYGSRKMTLSSNGNLGIGTTNPLANLHIKYANGIPSAYLRLESSNTDQNASTQYVSGGVFRWELGTGLSAGANFELYDRVNNKSSLVVNPGGFVGIGTISPGALLEVNGKAIVRSSFYTNDIKGYDGGNITIGPNTGGASSTIFMIGGANASEAMRVNYDKNVGIGSTNPDSKLTVKGKIHAEEVKVDLAVPADYVFEKYYLGQSSLKPDYTLLTLSEVEKFTEANHHLPNVPSAKDIKENGLLLGEMSNVLLQKIEELTLYVIEQNKELKRQTEDFEKQNALLKCQNEKILTLEKKIENMDSLKK